MPSGEPSDKQDKKCFKENGGRNTEYLIPITKSTVYVRQNLKGISTLNITFLLETNQFTQDL